MANLHIRKQNLYRHKHRQRKVIRITALIITGDIESKLQHLQWRQGQSPWWPFGFYEDDNWCRHHCTVTLWVVHFGLYTAVAAITGYCRVPDIKKQPRPWSMSLYFLSMQLADSWGTCVIHIYIYICINIYPMLPACYRFWLVNNREIWSRISRLTSSGWDIKTKESHWWRHNGDSDRRPLPLPLRYDLVTLCLYDDFGQINVIAGILKLL